MARTQGSDGTKTETRLREVAEELIAAQGYAAVSMRQIAKAVGVQVGALYRYTPDKQTLLFNLMKAHMEDVLAAWDAADRPSEPAVVRLEAFCRFHIRFHLDRPRSVFIAYMELRNLSPENFEIIESYRRAYEDRLEAIVRQGLEEQTIRVPDARLATMALISMLTGVTTWYREGGRLSRERVDRIYWRFSRRMLRA